MLKLWWWLSWLWIIVNFWKKKIPNQTWVSYRSTNYAEAITVGTQIRSYVDSFDSESGIHIELTTSSEGNLT